MYSSPKSLLLVAICLLAPFPGWSQSADKGNNFLSASAPPDGWPKYPQTFPDAAQLHATGPTASANLYNYGITATPAQIAG